ncbi:putative alpha-galactosidase B [Glycine soja]
MIVSSQNAITPPRGWNSYDSFSWIISEEEYLQNANIISQKLLPYGYQYAIVDYLWYRSLKGDSNSLGFDMIDKWGRMLPDPERWPSSRGGGGFTEVANKVHSMGLKFGIHLMAGISTQAYNKNTPILDTATGQPYMESGRVWNAKDIGIPSRACKWMTNGFMAINAKTGAGKAFLRSIYELYASWGVDFAAHEGPHRATRLTQDEQRTQFLDITTLNDVKTEGHNVTKVPFTYSLAITECTDPKASGWSSEKYNQDLERICYKSSTQDQEEPFCVHKRELPIASPKQSSIQSEQIWKLKSNGTLVNGYSGKCATVGRVLDVGDLNPIRSWVATHTERGKIYVAFFNLNKETTTISANIADLPAVSRLGTRRKLKICAGTEIWSRSIVRTKTTFSAQVPGHGSADFATSNLIGGKGLKGETYVAFFNLNNEKTTISASIVDLAMVHPGRRKFRLCSGNEMWSGRTIQTNNMFSAEVQGHGCALFVLQCSRICPKILFEYLLFIFQVTVMFWFVFCQVMVV